MSTTTSTSYASSVVALVLGIGLAVGVSTVFGLLGWGGELASQTAGAASGAAPLIIDGIRQRRSRTERQELGLAIRGLPSLTRLLIATLFAFAVLLTDNLLSLAMSGLSRASIWLSKAPDAGWLNVYLLLSACVQLPLLLLCTYAYGVAAAHRIGVGARRWVVLGVGIYVVVRVATVLALRIALAGAGALELTIGALVIGGLLLGAGLIGARRARTTQARYQAARLFRRLPPEDQQAVLALIGDTAGDRLGSHPTVSARELRDPQGPGASS